MNLSMRDWTIALLFTSVLNSLVANFLGNRMAIADSIPGVLILAAVAFIGVCLSKAIPLKLPAIVYVALTGLIIASPISPVAGAVIQYTGKISFMAPLTIVGTLAGIGLDFKSFQKQSWKMLIIALLVFTGTFLVQATFAEAFLRLTGAI